MDTTSVAPRLVNDDTPTGTDEVVTLAGSLGLILAEGMACVWAQLGCMHDSIFELPLLEGSRTIPVKVEATIEDKVLH